MAEWFKAPVLKTGVGSRSPGVRIPPHPPDPAYVLDLATRPCPPQSRWGAEIISAGDTPTWKGGSNPTSNNSTKHPHPGPCLRRVGSARPARSGHWCAVANTVLERSNQRLSVALLDDERSSISVSGHLSPVGALPRRGECNTDDLILGEQVVDCAASTAEVPSKATPNAQWPTGSAQPPSMSATV